MLRDISERGRDLESVLAQYITFVKPAFEEFCLPVSAVPHMLFNSVCKVVSLSIDSWSNFFPIYWCYLDKEVCRCDHTKRSWQPWWVFVLQQLGKSSRTLNKGWLKPNVWDSSLNSLIFKDTAVVDLTWGNFSSWESKTAFSVNCWNRL